jgi:hypothetical protein
MNFFVTADTDKLIAGQEAVLEKCLKKISGEATPRDVKDLMFPTLPPLTQQ